MKLSADWAMVWITVVYVIATIGIFVYNGRSAKATREQVLESQRQFEESKRLEYRPYFDVSPADNNYKYSVFDAGIVLHIGSSQPEESVMQAELWQIKNIGAGTAINLSYRWVSEGCEMQTGELPSATLEKGELTSIFFQIQIGCMPQLAAYKTQASFYINYQDLLENKYEQEIILTYDVSTPEETELTDMVVRAPKLVK